VLQQAGPDQEMGVLAAYRLAFNRTPTEEEKHLATAFLRRQSALLAAQSKLLLPVPPPAGANGADAAALVDLCHALLNSNEFLYTE
jgi:hypothetical protein